MLPSGPGEDNVELFSHCRFYCSLQPQGIAMSDGTATPIADSLISEYNSALRNRKISRVFFALLILATVGAYVFMFWQVIADFRDKGLAQVQVELGEELSAYVPTLQRQLQRSSDRIVPAYMDAFVATWERDQERYLEVVVEEFGALERFAQEQTPLIQEAIAQLALDQEAVANEELAKIFGDEETFAEISLAYQSAMENQLAVFFEKHLEEHVAVADSIVRRLETIAASEPDKVEDSQALLGMMVELLGIEMQLAGQEVAEELAD